MKNCILLALALGLLACGDDADPVDNTVHLAGYLANSSMDGDNTASYWKDGVYTALTDEDFQSGVGSLYVDGSTVLIGGEKHSPSLFSTSVIWRDGIESTIDEAFGESMVASHNNKLLGVWLNKTSGWVLNKNGISQPIQDTAYSYAPMSMTIVGDDIYASGCASGSPQPPNYSPPQYAQYWKNGQLLFREIEPSNALSIFIFQNDVYMAGYAYTNDSPWTFACYWKNGQRFDLTDGSKPAGAKSIFVSKNHVYVAGVLDGQAVYWKDGEIVYLTSSGSYSMANSIFVKGTDVHVGGREHGYPAYWKNDAKQNIANQDKQGQIKFVVVGSN